MKKQTQGWLLALAFFTAVASCGGSADLEANVETLPVLLHVDYRDGGPGPIGFLLSVFDDGRVRFYSPRWKPYWSQLEPTDLAEVRHFIGSGALEDLDHDLKARYPRYDFACCDFRELGVGLGQNYSFGIPIHGDYPVPHEAASFIRFINRVGHDYFGRRYSVPVPLPAVIDAPSAAAAGRLTPRCSGQHPCIRTGVAAELRRR